MPAMLQGDPKDMPPTKMITSTCFQQTSYLVHINFSLCMIVPQSFQFVGRIVQILCSLQNVFQMTHLALQAHLQAALEIASDTNTFNYPGVIAVFKSPIVFVNDIIQVTGCFRTLKVLQITPKVKISEG